MRRGYTLTELLVVIVILGILAAVALPIAANMMADARTREATRIVAAQIAKARTHAAATGRPAGIWLELERPAGIIDPATITASTPLVRQCTAIYLAEVAAPYGGGTSGARAIVRNEGGIPKFVPLVYVVFEDRDRDGVIDGDSNGDGVPDYADADSDGRVDENTTETPLLSSLIRTGDMFGVRFDFKGPWFNFIRHPTNGFVYLGSNSTGQPVAPPNFDNPRSDGLPFQVLRLPERAGNPVTLPGQAAIDLSYSGTGEAGRQFGFGVRDSIAIMFDRGGELHSIIADGTPFPAMETVNLLIGKTARVGDPMATSSHASGLAFFDPELSNLAALDSFWVSVGRNGSVVTTENTPDADHASHPTPWNAAGQLEFIAECRAFAVQRDMSAK